MKVEDGGRAFPFHELSQEEAAALGGVRAQHLGMSLRDWFAGQALGGMLADPATLAGCPKVAAAAYDYADAMLAERKNGGRS